MSAPRRTRSVKGAPPAGAAALVVILLLAVPAAAWVVCPECDPEVCEPDRACDVCGRSFSDDGRMVGLVYIALPDKDRALHWAGPDTLCPILSADGLLAAEPETGKRLPWSEVAFYLPQNGIIKARDGTVHEGEHLIVGEGNPWCPRPPRLPARLLLRPWVTREWLFTPSSETISMSRVRVMATSWLSLQEGKREWARRHVGQQLMHPFTSSEDREFLSRLPELVESADPVYPDIPGLALEGRVLLDILVGEEGKPLCVVSLRPGSPSQSLQMAAVEAAYKWRFKSARSGRRAFATWVPAPFQFQSK
ncbi:MAG: TonB family protein [Candidatus Eisenbacteria bacterium]|nr:TonB family protein [Candidatus Eisenbacteria bacterium]